jgi:hypothetical protein
MLYLDLDDDPHLGSYQPTWRGFDPEKHPIIAMINVLAAQAMNVLGPTLWAALVLLWALAEFSSY